MRDSIIDQILSANRATLDGDGLALLHERLREENPTCVELCVEFCRALGVMDRNAANALIDIAKIADRSGTDNPFHNPAHSREVTVNWWLLARLHGTAPPALTRAAMLLGLIAAMGHDLHHDGQGNGVGAAHIPFRLESVAAATTEAVLCRHGVPENSRATVTAMILSTDVRNGYPYLEGAGVGDARFAPLGDEVILLCAQMLRDADLLPSAGTSIAAYRARTAELERESGLTPGAWGGAAGATFFETVVRHRFLSPAARLFAPNLAMIAAASGASAPRS